MNREALPNELPNPDLNFKYFITEEDKLNLAPAIENYHRYLSELSSTTLKKPFWNRLSRKKDNTYLSQPRVLLNGRIQDFITGRIKEEK